MKKPSLSALLKADKFPQKSTTETSSELEDLQLKLLRLQQRTWHEKLKAVLVFEGFDASGKGGTIRRLTQNLDPRGFRVHPIGPPTREELGRHYLDRFWKRLPDPGTWSIFDRSWYGRVLVERVDELTPEKRWRQGYREIREFERMLTDDGTPVIKIFLGISKKEQLERFHERMNDPYKRWKMTSADLSARKKWKEYVRAADEMMDETHTDYAPWHLIAANDKDFARIAALKIIGKALTKNLGCAR